MLSSYGLQRLVPDHIRGRIFAFDFALITLSLGISSLLASALADQIGPRVAVMIVGGDRAGLGRHLVAAHPRRRCRPRADPSASDSPMPRDSVERPPAGAE